MVIHMPPAEAVDRTIHTIPTFRQSQFISLYFYMGIYWFVVCIYIPTD
jgi:hypothetical protein